jgi:hypothetical protein
MWLAYRSIKPLGKLQQHHFDTTLDVEDHVLRLIKEICGSHLKIRLHHEAAKKN